MTARDEIECFELDARECALMDEDLVHEYAKRFPLFHMNSREREAMIDAIVAEEGITGGWFWQYCLPGCMPTSEFPNGPFESYAEAYADALEDAATYDVEDE